MTVMRDRFNAWQAERENTIKLCNRIKIDPTAAKAALAEINEKGIDLLDQMADELDRAFDEAGNVVPRTSGGADGETVFAWNGYQDEAGGIVWMAIRGWQMEVQLANGRVYQGHVPHGASIGCDPDDRPRIPFQSDNEGRTFNLRLDAIRRVTIL